MHVLPQLRELERRFERELVVVGVHSGKFKAERVTRNIAQAARRLGVEHAIVNDRQYRVWRAFGVNAWPTVVLIDPAGDHVGTLPGEFEADRLAPVIQELIDEFDRDDAPEGARLLRTSLVRRAPLLRHTSLVRRAPVPLHLPPEPATTLRFPGKTLAVSAARLFVADTGHDRVLELALEGVDEWRRSRGRGAGVEERPRARITRVIGSGRKGRADGPLAEAEFDRPLGMALRGDTLYVADSDNNLIRAVDLGLGEVTTIAGTGHLARRFNEAGIGTGVALSTPWDLALRGDALVVAMAGFHQLWRLDLTTLEAGPAVGTGREDISDGPAFRCTLAQPTGLHISGDRIYFADSETSAIRYVEEGRHGPDVRTIVGKGLFDFGDEDGKGGHVRLQHAYGVTEHDGLLYVADTYNNKIKRIDPATGVTETFLGDGEEGANDGDPAGTGDGDPAGTGDGDALPARFDEPEGVAVADGLLFVTDTNNHAIRVTDLREGAPQYRRVTTLEIDV